MNAYRQPKYTVTNDTITGVINAPTFDPELNHPVASARSFFGNHSETDFTAAGKLADSPIPRKNLANPNPATDLERA